MTYDEATLKWFPEAHTMCHEALIQPEMQMSEQQVLLEIANAKQGIENIGQMNASFLEWLRGRKDPPGIPAKLHVHDVGVAVSFFEHRAEAKVRFVKAERGMFVAEYVFYVQHGGEQHEVWRFYLSGIGHIFYNLPGPSSDAPYCEFNDGLVVSKILLKVVPGILNSPVFSATKKPPSPARAGIYG